MGGKIIVFFLLQRHLVFGYLPNPGFLPELLGLVRDYVEAGLWLESPPDPPRHTLGTTGSNQRVGRAPTWHRDPAPDRQ